MTQAYTLILDAIHETRQTWRFRRVAEGLLITAAATGLVLLLATLIDQVLAPGQLGRVVLASAFWCVAVTLAWRFVGSVLSQRHSDDYFAALLEQRAGMHNRLINALQLGRGGAAAPALVEAIVNDGVAAVENVEPGRAVASPLLARAATALGVVLLAAMVYLLVGGAAATTSLARVLLPLAEIAPFTHTWVELMSPDRDRVRLLEGSPLTVEAQLRGVVADSAELVWADAAGGRRSIAMRSAEAGRFTHTFDSLSAPGTLHVRAGDGRSRDATVVIDARPRVAGMSATIAQPAYTGREPRVIERFDGHVVALPRSEVALTIRTTKPLQSLTMLIGGQAMQLTTRGDDTIWAGTFTVDRNAAYRVRLHDRDGHEVDDPTTFTITLERDAPPTVAITQPGRDVQLRPDQPLAVQIAAQDDHGLSAVRLLARRSSGGDERVVLQEWTQVTRGAQRVTHGFTATPGDLGLNPGDRLEYWAEAIDHLDVPGPNRTESRRYHLLVTTPQTADQMIAMQIADYAKVVEQLIKAQRQNRAETAELRPAAGLIQRQTTIREQTLKLADLMRRNAFPARTMMDELDTLAAASMAQVVTGLEGYRDAATLDDRRRLTETTLPVQDHIIASLESILERLNRGEQVRQTLRRMERTDPTAHGQVLAAAARLAADLDSFLTEMRQLDDQFDKMTKQRDSDVAGADLDKLTPSEHRLDRWGKWAKDTVDEILKLPEGFVKDSMLAENVSTIFEEIEKKQRAPMTEIATPVEEGAKVLATEVAEDLEMWMPDAGDSIKWTMEDPVEGRFEVPEFKLPDNLQDMVGDLIEDVEEFDEEADDVTGGWGGNIQVGWDIADGPISSFAALGKTGNQLPNDSEMSGRSGAGRRGKSSGQMVGAESSAMEGRPTPARLTNEPYEEGQVDAGNQLDPRGATGGGRKTGGGTRGLQGGTPPDLVKDMQRLAEQQKLLREQSQRVARQLEYAGRPSERIDRAAAMMQDAEHALRDLRYDDAARLRKDSIAELRAAASQIDQGVSLSLQRARDLPPDMRQQIISGSRQAMPEGYEELVGEYFKALSGASD
jgi:hypothetical protein